MGIGWVTRVLIDRKAGGRRAGGEDEPPAGRNPAD